MRKATFTDRELIGDKWVDKDPVEVIFHQFGIDTEEYEMGPGQFTSAVIELPTGELLQVYVNLVKFSPATVIEAPQACRSAMWYPENKKDVCGPTLCRVHQFGTDTNPIGKEISIAIIEMDSGEVRVVPAEEIVFER